MTITLFAGLRVADLATARPFYERLFGAPAFFPNEDEIVWTPAAGGGGSVYVLRDPERAGHGLVTLFAEDLDAALAEIAGRGLEPTERETYGNGVRKAVFLDSDGNEIGFAGGAAE